MKATYLLLAIKGLPASELPNTANLYHRFPHSKKTSQSQEKKSPTSGNNYLTYSTNQISHELLSNHIHSVKLFIRQQECGNSNKTCGEETHQRSKKRQHNACSTTTFRVTLLFRCKFVTTTQHKSSIPPYHCC